MWDPEYCLNHVKFSYYLTSAQNNKSALTLAHSILLPDDDKYDGIVPHPEMIRQWGIKIDAIDMAHERHLHRQRLLGGWRVARFFMVDGSEQGKLHYQAGREERMVRAPGQLLSEPFNPFKGFSVERLLMPLTTYAKGKADSAHKTYNFLHSLILISGVDHLKEARNQTRNFLSDQAGPESKTAKNPTADIIAGKLDGGDAHVQVARLKLHAAEFDDDVSRDVVLLPNSLDMNGIIRKMANNLRRTIEAVEEWPEFEELLKGVTRTVGNPEDKGNILTDLYADADKEQKASRTQVEC